MEHERLLHSIVLLLLSLSTACLTDGFSAPITIPMQDQYIAVNSLDNVTYSCEVDSGSKVVWEVERSQIRNQRQFEETNAIGIFIEPGNTASNFSTVTISSVARENNSAITIQCLASKGITSSEGVRYQVITFDPPEVPGDLILEPALTLEWKRPTNIPTHENVTVNYTVTINSTEEDGMNFVNVTSHTSLSVHFLEEILIAQRSECVEFEFSVSATNDAGTGPLTRILDTIPISPDVRVINNELVVQKVDLQTSTAEISFPPVKPCSINFPLTNYTLNIDKNIHHILTPDHVVLGESVFIKGLPRDRAYSLTVTACNNVTCRTSEPRSLNTTDVQSVDAVFFVNRLFLRCSFAYGSKARGCIFQLMLSSTNETESFEVSRGIGFLCTTANNQREAYNKVVVLDLEENEKAGNVSVNITTRVRTMTSLAMYTTFTGCKGGGNISLLEQTNDSSSAVGAVLGTLTIILVITVTVVLTVLFLLNLKKKKIEETADFATLTRKKKLAVRGEKEHLIYGCDVPAGKECAKRIETDLSPESTESIKVEEDILPLPPTKEEYDDKSAWIEGHDDPNQPLTINVRWKPLIQALIDSHSLKPGSNPLLPEGKVQWQLHMDN